MQLSGRHRAYGLLIACCAGLGLWWWDGVAFGQDRTSHLAVFGYDVTSGAAPGYIEDASCRICHEEIYTSYQEVGMARSFASAKAARVIEDYDAEPYFHPRSKRFYEMRRSDDGALRFRRWIEDENGKPVHSLEIDVDWVMGSGHTSRVYFFQTPSGELFQLPIAWYTQGKGWGMAPGFDTAKHYGVSRRVRRECMFCHNAYPDVPEGSDLAWRPQTFPTELPHGTGCQRCHGPGARHVGKVFAGKIDPESIQASIVNPARLSVERSRDICYGCHMQPTVELMGVRRFERADYSFRPGEKLSDYLVLMDVEAEGKKRSDRFEINHHPYRMEQSACFLDSESTPTPLTCLTCHDPHRKVPVDERPAHYRAACLSCHAEAPLTKVPEHLAGAESAELVQDCVSCHMPRRRTQDVIHVAMTDHKIQRHAGGPELLAPLEEEDSILIEMDFLNPDDAPDGPLGEAYKAVALLQAGGGENALDHLERQFDKLPKDDPLPWGFLANAQLSNQRWADAEQTVLARLGTEDETLALEWWGLIKTLSQPDKGEALFRKALETHPDRPELHFNLALALLKQGAERRAEGLKHLERAVELRPVLLPAWIYISRVHKAEGRMKEAEAAVAQALAIDPDDAGARKAWATLHEDTSQEDTSQEETTTSQASEATPVDSK